MDTRLLIKLAALLLVAHGLTFNLLVAQQTTDNQVDELMEVAIEQMNDGNYEEANLTFRQILKLDTVLPDDLSYLFAETLYMVNQVYNSRSFLDKYIRLAGSNGQYYSQALDLKHFLDDEYELILVCKLCDNRGYSLVPCDLCEEGGEITNPCFYCRGVGITRCESCKGKGVVSSYTSFGAPQFETCTNCEGKGQAFCKVCEGAKTLSDPCPACLGTHMKASNEICDHETAAAGYRHRMIGTFE